MSNRRQISRKVLKESQNINRIISGKSKKPNFGICFDIDGVLAHGTIALPQGVRAMKMLHDDKGDMKVPIMYVTNSLNRDQDKANQISNWFNINVSPTQMIGAQGPLKIFNQYKGKHCLVIGQGKVLDIVNDLGFTNICTLDEISEAYPLLDMVDHDNRRRIAREGYTEKEFPRVEAILLLGEPKRWESSLQLLVDLLRTDGKPDKAPEAISETHIPIIACNMDLQFKDRACMPRYGHGAFLLCLEALYKKVTGYEMKYTSLVGKPSEITFRYAEHGLSTQAKKLGIDEPLERMYMIGDTPDSDIVGSNLYQRYLDRLQNRENNRTDDSNTSQKDNRLYDPELPESRNVPTGANLKDSTVLECHSILVCTGVYKPEQEVENKDEKSYHGHRDFAPNPELAKPSKLCQDVHDAIEYILTREGMLMAH